MKATETITGFPICDPETYWIEVEGNYSTPQEIERAQREGLDHFGNFTRFGNWFCYRCGFVCEGEEEKDNE